MSTNRNRAKLNKAENGREYQLLWLDENYPMYWEEGLHPYPQYRRGFKNPNKQIFKYQVRMYRTWKYNRRTQWKKTK
jgi:hypothetical protein